MNLLMATCSYCCEVANNILISMPSSYFLWSLFLFSLFSLSLCSYMCFFPSCLSYYGYFPPIFPYFLFVPPSLRACTPPCSSDWLHVQLCCPCLHACTCTSFLVWLVSCAHAQHLLCHLIAFQRYKSPSILNQLRFCLWTCTVCLGTSGKEH